MTTTSQRLAIFMPSLTGGGAERVLFRLAEGFSERGHEVDLLLSRIKGDHGARIPPRLDIVRLSPESSMHGRAMAVRAAGSAWPHLLGPVILTARASWALRYLPDLARYLEARRPRAMLAANSWPNLVALWARRSANVSTRVVVSERVNLSERIRHLRSRSRWRHLPGLIGVTYPEAEGIVAVSAGVADDLVHAAGLPRERVTAILNPVVSPDLFIQAAAAAPDPWLVNGGPPVVLAAGRLHPQKDFGTLLRAFARARADRPLRLIILGEGPSRSALQRLSRTLDAADAIRMPGHVPNPYAYMARAALFVLSSRYEGLPGVLTQALACGCPVVSTDCPSGPAEILEDGRFGPLVPVGDDEALAAAMLRTLDAPPDRSSLSRRGLDFGADLAIDQYLSLLLGTA